MIQKIKNDKSLTSYLHTQIKDAGIEVQIANTISEDEFVAIKVDDYYAGLKLGKETPKSVDFVVVVDNSCQSYNLYILEFKNIQNPKHFEYKDIKEKFINTIHDFLSQRFSDIFLSDAYQYKDICIALISDAYVKHTDHTYEEFRLYHQKRGNLDSLRLDNQLLQKPLRFRHRLIQIKFFESDRIQICKTH